MATAGTPGQPHSYVFAIRHEFNDHFPPSASITLHDAEGNEVGCTVKTMHHGESPNEAYDELIGGLQLQGVLF